MKRINVLALFLPEIKELLRERSFAQIKQVLSGMHSMDLAEGFHNFADNEKIIIFRLLGQNKAIEVFESVQPEDQKFLLNNLASAEISQILNEMSSDERVDLFHELSPKVVKKFFSLMRKEEVDDVKSLITYPEGTAGSIMTTDAVCLRPDMSARAALLKLQEELKTGESEHIYASYVLDSDRKLIGAVDLQDIIVSSPHAPVKEIMTSIETIKVTDDSDAKEVGALFVKYDLLSVPVVNEKKQFVGMIVFDDIVDSIQHENTKEMYELGKMHVEEGAEIRYSHTNSFDLLKRRAGWLMFLLVFDFLTGTVLKSYEHALSSVVALSFFIPMLLDTGGNAGAQVSVTIIRGLAIGDVGMHNVWDIIKKESIAAFFMSLFVGLVAFLRAYLLQGSALVALVVGATMSVIVLLAVSTGIFLPLASKKIGLDPAVLAGPITTSIVDIVGLIIYFNIAIKLIPALSH
ncbi:MAG: magnesium transporter [Elusimicrobiota bacterium]